MILDSKDFLLFIRADTTYSTDDTWGSSAWNWGRWILFVIFIAFILILVFCTARVNRRRRVMGQAPIRGTSWLTPPSYRQSERQYVGNTQQYVEDYVPEYTENTNENDLGYYDERGEFHSNGKTEYIPPPKLASDNASDSLERPNPVMVREPMGSDMDLDFNRPTFQKNNNLNTFPGYFNNEINNNNELTEGLSSSSNDQEPVESHMKGNFETSEEKTEKKI